MCWLTAVVAVAGGDQILEVRIGCTAIVCRLLLLAHQRLIQCLDERHRGHRILIGLILLLLLLLLKLLTCQQLGQIGGRNQACWLLLLLLRLLLRLLLLL